MDQGQNPLVETAGSGWRSRVARLYQGGFLFVWLLLAAFLAINILAENFAPRTPTAAATFALAIKNGHSVYLPFWLGRLAEQLKLTVFIGMPSFFALGFLLHFGLGVKLFSNLPTGRKDEP